MAIPIGFFQVDNLVRNRIPFFLLKDESNIEPQFGPVERLQLRNLSLVLTQFTVAEAEALIQERGGNLQSPIVILCEKGDRSQKLAEALESKGYLNLYFLLDGIQSIGQT